MSLTENRDLDHYIDQQLRTVPAAELTRIHKGALVGLTVDGYARGLRGGDRFAGIAYEECDNSGGSAGGRRLRVFTRGDFALPLAGVSEADRLRPVFALDDEAVSLTGAPPAGYVGRVVDRVAPDTALVRLAALGADVPNDPAARLEYFEDFIGADVNVTDGAWTVFDVGNATQEPVADAHGGQFSLALSAVSEAQDAVLYQGNRKNFDIDAGLVFECRAKLATPGSGVTVVFGLAGSHHIDKDSIAQNAWFRLQGALNLLVETDDGSTNLDDRDTGVALLADTWYTFRIDLTDPSDVRFFLDRQRLLPDTMFDMSAFDGRLQPYFSLDKATGTGTAELVLDWVRVTGMRM